MRFIHAADLHIDSPLRGLERYEGAPAEEIRGATRRACENLVDLCIGERVDFLVIAGDLYDGNWPDYNTGLFFTAQMQKLRRAGIRVYIVRGNHDAESQITRKLRLPDNTFEFNAAAPQTFQIDALKVALHGQSFLNAAVTEDLSAGYPEPRPGYLNIGLLHTSATGREGHAPYAPCSVSGLAGKGYDYWALGHVHTREVLHEAPFIVFPGNTQGRHIRETGPKGCSLVSVVDGRIARVEHRSLDVLRWDTLALDLCGIDSEASFFSALQRQLEDKASDAEGRTIALRICLRGTTRLGNLLHAERERVVNEMRALANAATDGRAWIEKVQIDTRVPARLNPLRSEPLSELAHTLAQVRADPEELRALAAEFKELMGRLPQLDVPRLDEAEGVLQRLDAVEAWLYAQLDRDEGDA